MRAQRRLIRGASIALCAAALQGAAQAEGGLPGSPPAVTARAPAPEAGSASAGGAAFNPFADRADAGQPAVAAPRDRDGAGPPGLGLTAAVTLAGIAALGWLARLALR